MQKDQRVTNPKKLVELEKKKKKGRPEEENSSQETSLPDYPTGLIGVQQTEVDKVIAVLQILHGTSHVVF